MALYAGEFRLRSDSVSTRRWIFMIPSMIFVAGMSDVVHFYTKYSEEIERKKTVADRVRDRGL